MRQNSSGFQSAQFREWEFMLGHKREGPLRNYPEGSPDREALERSVEKLFDPARGRCGAEPEEDET